MGLDQMPIARIDSGSAEFDVSPLQKAFLSLASKVDHCTKENAALRAELAEMRILKRIEALEQGLQEVADNSRPMGLLWGAPMMHPGYGGPDGAGAEAAGPGSDGTAGADDGEAGPSGSGGGAAAGGASGQPSLSRLPSMAPGAAASAAGGGGAAGPSGVGAAPASAGGAGANAGTSTPNPGAVPSMGSLGAAHLAAGASSASLMSARGPGMGPLGASPLGYPGGLLGPMGTGALGGMGTPGSLGGAGGLMPRTPPMGGGMVDGSWLVQEVVSLRERLAGMERKAEALWHAQEDDEQLRGSVERLRADMVAMQGTVSEAQASAAAAQSLAEKQTAAATESVGYVKELQDRLHTLELGAIKGADERRELASKYESTTGQIWDQLRHVEGSLAQRLTMAETSHVAALQEVDEAKDATSEVLQRVDDVKRHTSALEGKLESFNTQVAAALNPLHNALALAQERLESLAASKQDTASAIKAADVELGVARAIDHADRRGDGLLKAIAGVEARLEALADSTPNRGEVVLTCDLEGLLTEHARELDAHLDRLKGELLGAVAAKVNREELGAQDLRTCSRLDGLEGALLKGLRAISDKVSAALGEKLDLSRFNEFKLQVRAILADVEDRLRDWSPLALGTKAQLGTDAFSAGGAGAPSCLCCDSRVRTVRDLRAMGFKEEDRVFSPDKLPLTDPMFPSIQGNRAATLGAHHNARIANRNVFNDQRLRATNSLMESLPSTGLTGTAMGSGGPGGSLASTLNRAGSPSGGPGPTGPGAAAAANSLAAAVDAGSFASLPPAQTREDRLANVGLARQASARGVKVKVETIAGGIMKGQLPSRPGANAPPTTPTGAAAAAAAAAAGGGGVSHLGAASASAVIRGPRSPVAAAATATGPSAQLLVVGAHGGSSGGGAGGQGLSGGPSAAGVDSPRGGGGGGAAAAAVAQAAEVPVSPWPAQAPSPTQDKGPVLSIDGGMAE
ncbi:hypothetical protein HYH03_003368 [Edaphochlamys debaryana]|uniref:Uncharacterized protein n=1 Tax=Edaphochlamys debaryana TaxID=47281 RepID=A0A835YD30_9CHLO|nr:hypothetical protein HYH03_003368 [Edaphochlamys debaryana]|eukprot:KAG2498621.1 hypothetical protein HYH03_003368 [Edaphochlamys debaryana]